MKKKKKTEFENREPFGDRTGEGKGKGGKGLSERVDCPSIVIRLPSQARLRLSFSCRFVLRLGRLLRKWLLLSGGVHERV